MRTILLASKTIGTTVLQVCFSSTVSHRDKLDNRVIDTVLMRTNNQSLGGPPIFIQKLRSANKSWKTRIVISGREKICKRSNS